MVLIGLKISFIIHESKSLKDKRSVVKSIIQKIRNKYNVSVSEIGDNDIINKAIIGIGIVGNSYNLCNNILNSVIHDIENQYEIEINDIEEL